MVNTKKVDSGPASWKEFFEVTKGAGSGHTILHDYQLTTIGAALCSLGYSFNSIDENELAEAEAVLIEIKAASVRNHFRLPARYAQWRCLDVNLLERRWYAIEQ